MKKLSRIFNESVQPGNQLNKTGVTNHYTPIQNILTNINNKIPKNIISLFSHLNSAGAAGRVPGTATNAITSLLTA